MQNFDQLLDYANQLAESIAVAAEAEKHSKTSLAVAKSELADLIKANSDLGRNFVALGGKAKISLRQVSKKPSSKADPDLAKLEMEINYEMARQASLYAKQISQIEAHILNSQETLSELKTNQRVKTLETLRDDYVE